MAMIVQHGECTQCQGLIHFKMVNFTLYVFYHNNTKRLEVQGEATPT